MFHSSINCLQIINRREPKEKGKKEGRKAVFGRGRREPWRWEPTRWAMVASSAVLDTFLSHRQETRVRDWLCRKTWADTPGFFVENLCGVYARYEKDIVLSRY